MTDWIQVRLEASPENSERLCAILIELGAGGVEERPRGGGDWPVTQPWERSSTAKLEDLELVAWLPASTEHTAIKRLQAEGLNPSIEHAAAEDWEENWKKQHHAVQVSASLRVAPPWEAQEGDLVIEPGNAFGTGEHPATRACLEAVEDLAPGLRSCLDVGCGSGVLAIAANRHGLAALGVDIDPDAVAEARKNSHRNNSTADFTTTGLADIEKRWDLVVANLYAEVICDLSNHLVRVTGKHLVLAGILADRWEMVAESLCPPLVLTETRRDGDWISLRLERM